MKPLEFKTPATVDEALSLLGGGEAAPLAGGSDLIIQWREGRKSLKQMVDVKNIPELNVLSFDTASGLRLGAAVSCARLGGFAPGIENFPALVEGAELIGSTQIQSRASVGGNICNGSPAADTICALIVLGATMTVQGPGGKRSIAAADFMTGPGQTALKPGELLVEIQVPPQASAGKAKASSAYMRFIPRNEMDIAVAGAAVSLVLTEDGKSVAAASVAIGAVAPTPLLVPAAAQALVGSSLDEKTLERVAQAASEAASPITDLRGTVEFRTHVVGVLARRVAQLAWQRAQEKN